MRVGSSGVSGSVCHGCGHDRRLGTKCLVSAFGAQLRSWDTSGSPASADRAGAPVLTFAGRHHSARPGPTSCSTRSTGQQLPPAGNTGSQLTRRGCLPPGDRHADILGRLLSTATCAATWSPAPTLAALAIEHGVAASSFDSDLALPSASPTENDESPQSSL
jgi:hypothetical protein